MRRNECSRRGRFGCVPAPLKELVRTEFGKHAEGVDLFVIDEIGKMECFSAVFIAAATAALDVPVSATIAAKGGGFIAQVKARPDVDLVTVTQENRGGMLENLAARLLG